MKPAEVLLRAWLREPSPDPLERRDPQAISAFMATFGPLIDAWFATEVRGLEHIPDGPALLVGTHNGGLMTPDMWGLMLAGWRHFGPELPAYGLAHDQVMRFPPSGRAMGLLGAVPARPGIADRLLSRGARVLVYPGGDVDAFKPWSERHVVKFAGRTGFIRLALRQRVPIVPVVSVGAHETLRILTDGRSAARALGLKRWLRIEVLPVFLCLPFGLGVGPIESHLPAPSRVRIQVLPPLWLSEPPDAADDALRVGELAEAVRGTMQQALDALAAEPGYGVAARLRQITASVRGRLG